MMMMMHTIMANRLQPIPFGMKIPTSLNRESSVENPFVNTIPTTTSTPLPRQLRSGNKDHAIEPTILSMLVGVGVVGATIRNFVGQDLFKITERVSSSLVCKEMKPSTKDVKTMVQLVMNDAKGLEHPLAKFVETTQERTASGGTMDLTQNALRDCKQAVKDLNFNRIPEATYQAKTTYSVPVQEYNTLVVKKGDVKDNEKINFTATTNRFTNNISVKMPNGKIVTLSKE